MLPQDPAAFPTSIAFEGSDSPFLVVGGSDGSFAVVRISLWRDEAIVAGKAPPPVPDPDFVPGTDDEGNDLKAKMVAPSPPATEAESGYAIILRQ